MSPSPPPGEANSGPPEEPGAAEPPAQSSPVPSEAELFWGLVRQYELDDLSREQILAQIEGRFRRPVTILVVDTCGFTRTVRGQGIVAFLALLGRLERIVIPLVDRAGGRMLFREADNFFAVFPDPASALECGEAILAEVREANVGAPPEQRLAVSIGVGHGEVLVIGPDVLYGDEMNLTCKIGEDLAGPDEMLLTPSARAALEDQAREFEERRLSISGLDVVAYRPLS